MVSFNASANPESAQALARSITYRSVTNAPLQDPRTVVFALADGNGATSTASKQIVVSKLHISDFQYGRDAGFGVYTDAHDCEIWDQFPDNSYPAGSVVYAGTSETGIQVDWRSSSLIFDEQMLLRFDNIVGTNAGQIPPGSILVQADLMLNILNSGDGSPLYRMLTPWNDPETWNTMGNGVQTDMVEAETSIFSQIGVTNQSGSTGVGEMQVSVLPDVQYWVNGGTNYGWVLPGWLTNADNTVFSPSESTNLNWRPRLRVTWLPAEAVIKSASFRQGQDGYAGAVDTRIRQDNPTTTILNGHQHEC